MIVLYLKLYMYRIHSDVIMYVCMHHCMAPCCRQMRDARTDHHAGSGMHVFIWLADCMYVWYIAKQCISPCIVVR